MWSNNGISIIYCAVLTKSQNNSKASGDILQAVVFNRDLVNRKSQVFFSLALGKTLRDKCFIGSERDWISMYSTYHAWNMYEFNSLFIYTMLHCKTATEIYSCSRKCAPLPFATMIDDNVKSNFELIKKKFSPISRYIEFCGLMYFNEWSDYFFKQLEKARIID